ncbi:ABC transporter ATP-binding protein [Halomicronema sp. CCY15110]|uniref:ABC transporter ATP-binding protein n=1 Tax=Halomicronema sp. CCY15110 TaxID=2767773 RepID=UPI001951D99B|nr:ABC transporter ATP-binding protein [Halomicronema sp. CCY15110]
MLMIVSAIMEVLNLAAVIPFLSSLSDPDDLLNSPRWQPILDLLKVESTSQLILLLTSTFIIITVINNLLRMAVLYIQTYISARISTEVGCLVYEHILLQPYEYHVRQNSSDLITLLSTDTATISNGVMGPLLLVIANGMIAVSLLIGLLAINPIAMLVALLTLGIAYVLIYRLRRKALLNSSQLMTQNNQQQIKIVQESLGGIQNVILANTYPFFQTHYARSNYAVQNAYASILLTSSMPRYGIEMIAMVFIGILALSLVGGGNFEAVIPVLGGLALGVYRLLPALQQLFSALARAQGARASLIRVLTAIQRPIDPMLKATEVEPLHLAQKILLEQVWFHYEQDDRWILQDLNLTIDSCTTVGFVGTTGSGKSTTVNVILGLLQPQKGRVFVDDEPLWGQRLRAWQLGVAYVPQSIFLADTTIANNIAFGIAPHLIDYDRVLEAAKLARIDEYIEGLPAKYETMLGERGVRLSGGQQQRIGIARALYRQASMIIFDEATSSLDTKTEKEVMAAIEGLRDTVTMVLIAHRLSTIQTCDRIFEFQDGRIVAAGTYNELLKSSGSFRRLAQAR